MAQTELRSLTCTEQLCLRFVNTCQNDTDIIWVDYSGQYVKYKTLKFNEFVDVDTYVTHPWLCMDSKTGDRMLIQNSPVFIGKMSLRYEGRPVRLRLKITYPLYSLKTCSLLVIRNSLGSADKIDELQIPTVLKESLRNVFN